MKVYLYKINGIPKMEDGADRHLIGRIDSYNMDGDVLQVESNFDLLDNLSKLKARSNYALRIESDGIESATYSYYCASAYQVEYNNSKITIKMKVNEID